MLVGLVIAVVVAVAIAIANGRFGGGRGAARAAEHEFRRLLALCYDDPERAERLVAAEARRDPSASRGAQIARAIERLVDDRRR